MNETATAAELLAGTGVDPDWLARVLPRVDPARVPVRPAPRWFRRLWADGIVAVAMPWAIYLTPGWPERHRDEPARVGRLIAHELAHIEQYRRLGAARHVGQYLFDYLRGRLRRRGHWESYRAVGLEVEARGMAEFVMGGPR